MGRRRCSWCYSCDHNRRTCAEYTESVKSSAEWEVKHNKGREIVSTWDRHHQKEYAKRTKADTLLDGTKVEKSDHYRRKSTRTCSYCGNAGHNRRKCEDFAKHCEKKLKLTSDYRKAIKKQLKDSGWGIGALVQEMYRGEVNENCSTYMIVGVNLNDVSYLSMRAHSNQRAIIKLMNINPNPKYNWDKEKEINLPALAPENFPKSIDRYSEHLTSRMKAVYDQFPQNYKLLSDGANFVYPKGWTGDISCNAAEGVEQDLKDATGPHLYENRRRAKEEDDSSW